MILSASAANLEQSSGSGEACIGALSSASIRFLFRLAWQRAAIAKNK